MVNHRTRPLFGNPDAGFQHAGLIDLVASGELSVPDFQRPYLWGRSPLKTCRLLASISQGWPAGALLLLEGDRGFENQSVRHWAQDEDIPLAGAPELAILDGQQRLTALYLAFFDLDPRYSFLVDINGALEAGRITQGEDREEGTFQAILRTQLAGRNLAEIEERATRGLIKLSEYRDIESWAYWKERSAHDDATLTNLRERGLLSSLLTYEFPTSTIVAEASIEVMTAIFVEINQSATRLSTFDLVTAKTLKKDETDGEPAFNLRDRWIALSGDKTVSRSDDEGDFLNARFPLLRKFNSVVDPTKRHGETPLKVLLLSEESSSLSAGAMVNLDARTVRTQLEPATEALNRALQLLHEQASLIPHTLADDNYIIPIAVQLFENPQIITSDTPAWRDKRSKLVRWYWSSSLQMLFGKGSTTSLLVRETKDLREWLRGRGRELPKSMRGFWDNWRGTLRGQLVLPGSRNGHFLKAILGLEVHSGARDWMGRPNDGDDYEEFPLTSIIGTWDDDEYSSLEVHHIWAENNRERPRAPEENGEIFFEGIRIPFGDEAVDCILNRCLLLKETNNLVDTNFINELDTIPGINPDNVSTYLLDPEADDWVSFVQSRISQIEEQVQDVAPPR